MNEDGNAPAGTKVHFVNFFIPDGEQNSVIVFPLEKTPGVW
ncbi:hypothetical protein [Massilia antarctica]|nr:hypothetical protein [Massilia antarctica]